MRPVWSPHFGRVKGSGPIHRPGQGMRHDTIALAVETICRSMLRLTLRLDQDRVRWLGPGKIRLLELIAEHGSIARAGREMGMSYRRAWLLVEAMNESLGRPVVAARPGGVGGGGAALTAAGTILIDCYRQIAADAERVAAPMLQRLEALLEG